MQPRLGSTTSHAKAGLIAASILLAGAAAAAANNVKLDVVYVPTPHEVVDRMMEMGKVSKGDFVIISYRRTAASPSCGGECVRAFGVDINPERVHEANENAKREGVVFISASHSVFTCMIRLQQSRRADDVPPRGDQPQAKAENPVAIFAPARAWVPQAFDMAVTGTRTRKAPSMPARASTGSSREARSMASRGGNKGVYAAFDRHVSADRRYGLYRRAVGAGSTAGPPCAVTSSASRSKWTARPLTFRGKANGTAIEGAGHP